MVRASPTRCPSCGSIYDENVTSDCPSCGAEDGTSVTAEAIHTGEREAILAALAAQHDQLRDADAPDVTCPCGDDVDLTRAFRCFYCEVWFCPSCAEEHFDGSDIHGD